MANRFNGFTIATAIVCLAVGAAVALLMTRSTAEAASRACAHRGRQAESQWHLAGKQRGVLGSPGARGASGMVTQPGVYPYDYARVPAAPVLALGAAAGVPGSLGVVQGDGQIPYKPEAAASRRRTARTGSIAIRS